MTERFLKTAGSPALESLDDPGFYAVEGKPAWVKVPDNVEGAGGQRVNVLRVEPVFCHLCKRGGAEATRYVLAPTPVKGGLLTVVECGVHGFLWLAEEEP